MSDLRSHSSPDLGAGPPDDSTLEGITANVKLLLKLIQDHGEACGSESDDRKVQRVAGMMSILDTVKTRIQKSQPIVKKKPEAELRRCNTDLRPRNIPRNRKTGEPSPATAMDDKQRLLKELNAVASNNKSLEVMCQSLGKEKSIMAAELARKAQELSGMEELLSDLKTQNEALMAKVQACKADHKDGRPQASSPPKPQGSTTALQERNKALSEQLLKSLDAYRALKRKYKDMVEESTRIRAAMEEFKAEVATCLKRIRTFQQGAEPGTQQPVEMEEMLALERVVEHFEMKISKQGQRNAECVKQKPDIHYNPSKPPVLA